VANAYWPAAQLKHLEESNSPVDARKRPTAHDVHAVVPVWDAYFPGAQVMHEVEACAPVVSR
jgi:hypothetical protein